MDKPRTRPPPAKSIKLSEINPRIAPENKPIAVPRPVYEILIMDWLFLYPNISILSFVSYYFYLQQWQV
jgi:hypothetical protein